MMIWNIYIIKQICRQKMDVEIQIPHLIIYIKCRMTDILEIILLMIKS